MKTAVILFGGKSNEYAVSLQSAVNVGEAIDKKKWKILWVGLTQEGALLWFDGEENDIKNDTWWHKTEKIHPLVVDFLLGAFVVLGKERSLITPDIVIPAMHGQGAEDGAIFSLCELASLPILGGKAQSHLLCYDKYLTKLLMKEEKIPFVPYALVRLGEPTEKTEKKAKAIGYPLFVKPCKSGSSVGISLVESEADLKRALDVAFAVDEAVLLEEKINGIECEVAILEKNGTILCSEVGTFSHPGAFYDYETKYHEKNVTFEIPCRSLTEQTAERIKSCAKKLTRATGVKSLARVDFFVLPEKDVFFCNEVNTLPGFTAHSMFPMLWEQKGLDCQKILSYLLE